MKHRLLAPLVAAVAVASMAACGSSDDAATTATSVVTVTRTAGTPSETVDPSIGTDPPVVTETVTSTQEPADPTTTIDPAAGGGGGTDASEYVGHYQRHSSTLDLAADRTGEILEGDGAIDGERWAVTWQPAGQGISMTYQRLIRKTGAGLYRHPMPGLVLGARYGTGVTGNRVLVVTQPAPRTSTIIWCLPRLSSPECGA